MLRRLFFLFPDEKHAQDVVDHLLIREIPKHRMHAISRVSKLTTLPEATERQKNDIAFHVEQILLKTNILLFSVALIILVASLVMTAWLFAVCAFAVMIITYFAGQQFITRIPDDHLTEFADALSRGEVLLMVDIPIHRLLEVERFVHRHHPDAVSGGVSWTMDAFGI
jgi:hypothetical protein